MWTKLRKATATAVSAVKTAEQISMALNL